MITNRMVPAALANGCPAAKENGQPQQQSALAYETPVGHLHDVAREIIARLERCRALRMASSGVHGRRMGYTFEVPRLPPRTTRPLNEAELEALSCGHSILLKGRTVTMPLLAESTSIPIEQWAELERRCRSHRLARTKVSTADHAARQLAEFEEHLDERWRPYALLALVSTLPGLRLVFRALKRVGMTSNTFHTDPEELQNLLEDDPLAAHLRPEEFTVDHPLVAAGIFQPFADVDDDERETRPFELQWPSLNPDFLLSCLGTLKQTMETEGYRLIHPTVRISEVVLSKEQAQQAAAADIAAAECAGRSLGVLLHGPSGTGKSLLAHALAAHHGRSLAVYDIESSELNGRKSGANFRAILQRCVENHTPLFIDEADQVFSRLGHLTQVALTAMDQMPITLILATNHPTRLDRAFARRMQVVIDMPLPAPDLRLRLIERELLRQSWPGNHPDPQDLNRLARGFPLSGGYWANIVMAALNRARQGQRDPGMDDLRIATAEAAFLGCSNLLGSDWEMPRPDSRWYDLLAGSARQDAIHTFATQLEEALQDLGGRGALLAIEGPDAELARASTGLLALRLCLPLIIKRIKSSNQEADGESSSDAGLGMVIDDGPGPGLPKGECAVILLPLQAQEKEQEDARRFEQGLLEAGHIVIRHCLDAAKDDLSQEAAARLPWARLDEADLQHHWLRLGGSGPAPRATHLRALEALVLRQRLQIPVDAGDRRLP